MEGGGVKGRELQGLSFSLCMTRMRMCPQAMRNPRQKPVAPGLLNVQPGQALHSTGRMFS